MINSKHVPVRTHTSRRALLRGAPAAALALASGGVAAASTLEAAIVDPHPEWLAEYRRVRTLWVDAPEDSEEANRLWDRWFEFEDLICQTPAHTANGLRAQMEWLLEDAADYWGCHNHEAAARNVLRGLRAAA